MQPLTSFVAIDRRHALVGGERLPDRVQGSLLFADVSGSTPLATALTHVLGSQRGTEELTYHINRILTPLIAQVHAYGGSVITFPGDAITCWFDGDNGRRATACGLAMQQAMRVVGDFTIAGGETATMAVKIAVVAGPARRFAVGNPRIQMLDVLAGRLLDRMSGVEALLDRGEVGIGAEVLAWLGPEAEISLWRTAPSGEHFAIVSGLTSSIAQTPWQDGPFLDRVVARPWLPPIIAERLERGEQAFIAELRLTIPVFLGFEGIDYDQDDAAGEKLDSYVNWVQTVLAHYGGHLLEITMGDKGSSLGMTFGAPVAYGDDAARAVAAAMELRSPPAAMSYIKNTRIGITQGQLYIGACGSDTRRTYIALGNEANIASRLKGYAQAGQILLSDRAAAAASGFEFGPLGPIPLRGLQEPLPVFEVMGQTRGRVGRTVRGRKLPAMVGREDELALLSARLRALQQGQGSCIIVGGEAAIGKSRLVEELQARAQASGILTLAGSGDAIERSTPYHAWRPVFYPLFDLLEGDDGAERDLQAHILQQIADDSFLAERAPLLNAVLPMQMADNELTAQMAGEVRATNTRDALVRVLQRAQAQGAFKLLLILEDAHWLDSASWALASAVRHRVQPAIELIVMRPLTGPVSAEYEAIRDDPGTHHVELGPLPESDIRLLVRRALDARELDSQVFELINRRSEGHPFFSQELAHALREAGLVAVDDDGVCRLTAGAGAGALPEFPDTIQGVITSRIDHLPTELQSLLKVSSVIGRDFGFDILHDIYPVEADKPRLRTHLRELEHLDLVRAQSGEPDPTYLFKHIITQEVAYNLMLFARRRDLHRAIARWHEQAHALDLTPYFGLLAHHWGQADEPPKAVAYLGQAGEQALASFANQEAVGYLEQALDLVESSAAVVAPDLVARWTLQLGEAHISLSQYAEGTAQLENGLDQLQRPVPRSKGSRTASILGQVVQQLAHRAAPSRYVGRAEKPDTMRRISRAYERLAEAGYVANDTLLSLYGSLAALNVAELGGDSPELARGYVAAGVMMGLASLHRFAEGYIGRAFDTVVRIGSMSARSHISLAAGFYYMGVGNWQRISELLESTAELSQRLGDVRGREGALGNLGIATFVQGDFVGALALAGQVWDSAHTRDDALYQSLALALRSSCLCQMGRCAEAADSLANLERVVEKHRDVSSGPLSFLVYDTRLALALQRQEPAIVAEAIHELSELLAKGPLYDAGNLAGYSNLAEACLGRWEANPRDRELQRQSARACKHLSGYARLLPIGRPRAALWRGEYAWLCGRRAKAQRLWQKSLHSARDLDMHYDEGLANYAAGRRIRASDPQRAELLIQARDTFAALGAEYGVARANAALAGAAD